MNAAVPAATPFWATPRGVHLIAGLYFLIFALIATTLHSALGVDDALENYNAQSWAISYSPRNPPLYDWLLLILQKLLGTGAAGFAALNYGALFATAMVFYRVAQRVISDPRLQALSIYAFSLLWDIGHESHRILTHSNLMILAIAATVLIMLMLAEKRTLGRYAALGVVAALGMLSKFGFVAFAATAFAAALCVPAYRRVVLDPRIVVSIGVAGAPLIVFYLAALGVHESIAGAATRYLSPDESASLFGRLSVLARAYLGYVLPLALFAALVFFVRPRRAAEPAAEEQADFRRFAGWQIVFGSLVAVAWVMVLGSTQVRPRYFHALLLLFPIFLFATVQTIAWTQRQARVFLGIAAATALLIMAEQTIARLAPSETLCGTCRISIPYDRLGDAIVARVGEAPVIVAPDPIIAGQMRAAVPGARVVSLEPAPYRPPPRPAGACLMVWSPEDGDVEGRIAPGDTLDEETLEVVTVAWFQPLLSDPPRRTSWTMLRLAPDSEPCR